MPRERTRPHRAPGIPLRTLRVEVVSGADTGRTHVATADTISVGTAPGNDLVLSDETVSGYHLELRRQKDRILVVDHGTTNGTALGTALIERATVAPGSVLALGETELRVDDGEMITLEVSGAGRLGNLLGRSEEMLRLMASAERAAQSDVSVLIVGETGTGKDLIARAIHEASARAGRPFETVDCGALLPTLIASELFGHEKGSFTGADRQHIGAFERANGGTLFLDEIGELPSALQPALLGALERRSFRRVGGHKAISVDVRLLAATHRDLRAEVNAGTFRQDLYYRMAVVLLGVAPLRDRRGDVPILIEHFLREAGFDGEIEEVVTPNAMRALEAHHWPGNVRELRNYVEAALAMGEAPELHSNLSRPPHDPAAGDGSFESLSRIAPHELAKLPYGDARSALLREFESFYLRELLTRTKDNVSLAAREAKMNRSHLIRLLKRHEIR